MTLTVPGKMLLVGDFSLLPSETCAQSTPIYALSAEPAQHESDNDMDIESIENLEERLFHVPSDHDWSPYPSNLGGRCLRKQVKAI